MTTAHLQALVLVFSLCLVTISAGPVEPTENPNLDKNTTENANTTTEPPTSTVASTSVTTTTVVMTTQPSEENEPEKDSEKTDDDKEGLLEPLDDKPTKEPSAAYLLYEVEKGIRGLSQEDILFVLEMEKGDNVVSLALADKLGYLPPNGDDSDPHVKVIQDNQEQLVSELKHKREKFEDFNKHTAPPTQPPPPVTTTAEDKEAWMEYNILKSMDHLTVEKIDELIDFDEAIPFALGDALGYEIGEDDSYFEYLDDEGAEKWRVYLLEARERRVKYELKHPATAPPKDGNNNDEVESNNDVEDNLDGKTFNGEPSEMDEHSQDGEEEFRHLPSESQEEEPVSETTEPSSKEGTVDPVTSNPETVGNTEESKNSNKESDGSFLEAGDEDESELEDLEETRSSFGAWHFLTIFILIGVAVVVGYVCVHNRKKLREGVGTYISDANKRRRRAREYKPLVNT